MKKLPIYLLLAFLLPSGLWAQKVYVDYDPDALGREYESFAWLETPGASLADTSPLMDSRIKNAIEYHLTAAGLVEDLKSPDLLVTYHGEERQELRINTTDWGYGYPRGWHYSPYWGGGYSTTSVSTFDVGTLMIDLIDAETKQLVWRGSATGTLPANPEKAAKRIDTAIAKIAKRWERMRRDL